MSTRSVHQSVIQFFSRHKPEVVPVEVDPNVVCGGVRYYIKGNDEKWYLVKEGDWGKYEFRGEVDRKSTQDLWSTLIALNDLIPR